MSRKHNPKSTKAILDYLKTGEKSKTHKLRKLSGAAAKRAKAKTITLAGNNDK